MSDWSLHPPSLGYAIWWLATSSAILGACGIIWLRRIGIARLANGWKMADGEIHRTDIVAVPRSEDDHYEALVRYTYRVGGRSYEGSQFRIGPKRLIFPQRSKAVAVLEPYHPGMRIQVRYDPSNPADCVLEPVPAANGLTGWAIMGGLMFLSGLYILFDILSKPPH